MIIGDWEIGDKNDFAVWIESRIKNYGTYERFGEKHEVNKSAVANWVKGERRPSFERLLKIIKKEGFKLIIKEK